MSDIKKEYWHSSCILIGMTRLIGNFLFLLLFASCGQQVNGLWPEAQSYEAYVEDAIVESYSYEFLSSSCSTGKISAPTFDEICAQLKNDSINENCAAQEREELFISASCSGVF